MRELPGVPRAGFTRDSQGFYTYLIAFGFLWSLDYFKGERPYFNVSRIQ